MSFTGSSMLLNISKSWMVGSFRRDLIQYFIGFLNLRFREGYIIKIPSKLLYLGFDSQ